MRVLIVIIGLAIGASVTWVLADMIDASRAIVRAPAQSTTNELPRILRPGLGFAFIAPPR